mgnify:CR=1 FL=1
MENINESLEFKSSPALREKLISYGTTKKFNAGDVILNENAYIRSIPIVLSGSIRVMRNDDEGREILLYYIKSGESCIMSFLGGIHQDTSKVSAVAEDETEILFVHIVKLITLIRNHVEWLDCIFRLYHKRFEELLEVVNAVAFKKIDERLILLLQKKSELSKLNTITITHEQLANELGTARVVVSRLLKQLEVDGRVELGRNKITLLK